MVDTLIRVSADDYMANYAHDHYEWLDGALIPMSPVGLIHDQIQMYVRVLLMTYFAANPIGQVIGAPFVMRLDVIPARREPDLQVILTGNPGALTPTEMVGAADLCIEIVSPESIARDYATKFKEYERGGVREYWIIDPEEKSAQLYRLNESGTYTHHLPDADGNYATPLLPRFKLHVPTLWAETLPNTFQIADAVRAMVGG